MCSLQILPILLEDAAVATADDDLERKILISAQETLRDVRLNVWPIHIRGVDLCIHTYMLDLDVHVPNTYLLTLNNFR
jgi:hypothetical protein